MIRHHFTVDVEEHFQVLALAPFVPRERWETLESRVALNVERLLGLLARHGATATFFTLGWVAERQPAMVKAIAAAGHEVASHGYDHRRVTEQTPDQFRESLRRTGAILEDLSGQPCRGFRAPNYSITPGREWALDILIEEGYRYDSSLFPVKRPGYGYASGGRDPYWITRKAGRLLEVPPATLRRAGFNLPAAGGAYFRLLPPVLVRAALRDAERRGQSGTFYVHPWEYDPDQPRFDVPALTRLRHYGNLGRTWGRLERLLTEFRFISIAEGTASMAPAAA
jgi:polysaccharide deacetylase family protein (PEP-CTERM system associated)